MTLLVNDDLADAATPVPRRRRWPWLVGLVVVLALVAAGTSAVVYAHTYSPLGPGNFTGTTVGALHGVTDGITDPTQYIVVGPPGSTGSIAFSLANNGSHPVTILGSGIPSGEGEARDISLSWADPYSNGDLVGVRPSDPRHPFPVTIAPHKQIALIVTVTKAQCPTGVTRSLDQIPIKTLALHVHHVWNYALPADANEGLAPIDVCSANSALKHLSSQP